MSLSEKLRPLSLEDLIQPAVVVDQLQQMLARGEPMNLVLYGSPGSGKTSAARILLEEFRAHSLNLNGSLVTGIDVVRDKIEPFATSSSLFGERKVVFIDEAENLSKAAQTSLRGVIELRSEVRYILTVNDITKLDVALQSRCIPICFDFRNGTKTDAINHLLPRYQRRLSRLGYDVDQKYLKRIIHSWFPDMRGAANAIELTVQPKT